MATRLARGNVGAGLSVPVGDVDRNAVEPRRLLWGRVEPREVFFQVILDQGLSALAQLDHRDRSVFRFEKRRGLLPVQQARRPAA